MFQAGGRTAKESDPVAQKLSRRPDAWVDFMMRFELGLEPPDPGRAVTSAGTIAGSYVAGGLIPLSPYVVLGSPTKGLITSAVVTLAALGIFGFLKGRYTGTAPWRSATQTMIIGGIAATAAFLLAKLIA
jgi:vacuolar iron transporter family protein